MKRQDDIKPGQVWINKKDGHLLFIGKKHNGTSWNTANSSNNKSHAVPFFEILERYELFAGAAKDIEENGQNHYVVTQATNATFKPKPWYMPTLIHKWLLDSLVEIHNIRIKANGQ